MKNKSGYHQMSLAIILSQLVRGHDRFTACHAPYQVFAPLQAKYEVICLI